MEARWESCGVVCYAQSFSPTICVRDRVICVESVNRSKKEKKHAVGERRCFQGTVTAVSFSYLPIYSCLWFYSFYKLLNNGSFKSSAINHGGPKLSEWRIDVSKLLLAVAALQYTWVLSSVPFPES